jgi:hypothetical protein
MLPPTITLSSIRHFSDETTFGTNRNYGVLLIFPSNTSMGPISYWWNQIKEHRCSAPFQLLTTLYITHTDVIQSTCI